MMKALCGCVLALAGCVSVDAALRSPKAADANELKAATEQFYAGTTVADLETAVELARKAGPDTAAYHAIAADLAALKADENAAFNHLYAALQDSDNPDAALELNLLTR